jgi:hypothetical protein
VITDMIRRLLHSIFGPPNPPWVAPRLIGELDEQALYRELMGRLDQVSTLHNGVIYFRDRETGQLWREQEQEASPSPPYCLHPVIEIPAGVPPAVMPTPPA